MSLLALTPGCATTVVCLHCFEPQGSDSLTATYKTEAGAGVVVECVRTVAHVKAFDRVFAVHAHRDDVVAPESLTRPGDERLDAWSLSPLGREPADDAERKLATVLPSAIVVGRDANGVDYVLVREPAGWRRREKANALVRHASHALYVLGALFIVPAILIDVALSPLEIVGLICFLSTSNHDLL